MACPEHGTALECLPPDDRLRCTRGCVFRKIRGIHRFVEGEEYASAFGRQWNAFRQTQLDSHTGVAISRDRLNRIAGGDLEWLKGKSVLEAGCGAGRFTEILLGAGAKVFAFDISSAVDANYRNFSGSADYYICQADILRPPVADASFEVVLCIGVVQHTPNPEQTIGRLCSLLRPGGVLLMDHYSHDYPVTPTRKWLRRLFVRMPPERSMAWIGRLTNGLWPVHEWLYRNGNGRWTAKLRNRFRKLSPIVDYQDAYPALGKRLLYQWALLDTHDTLTDVYKHKRSVEEILAALESCGMTDIHAVYAGNGVEARARKPAGRGS
jgi:SAM-dependent methyltransferase